MKLHLIRLFLLSLATVFFVGCATQQPVQTTTTTTETTKTHGYFR
jgi:uncharacterized lipoprotein YajG